MDDQSITAAFISQYQAALAMFRNAITALPAERWDNPIDVNPTWRIAYHMLYFTHLYLSGSESLFEPWEKAMPEAESIGHPWIPPADAPVTDGMYSPEDILAYVDLIESKLDELVPAHP